MCRVNGNYLAGDQPVEQHADAGEMLLDGGCRHTPAELLYIGGDMHRLDFIEPANSLLLAPMEKLDSGTAVRRARVRIADVDSEEFKEAGPGTLLGSGDDRRQYHPALPRRVSDYDQIAHAGPYHRPANLLGYNILYVRL